MRRAFSIEEMPYPADMTARNPARNIMPADVVAAPRHILKAMAPAISRKMKPRNSCQSECNGLTAAGTTCFTKVPELRTAGIHSFPASRAIFAATLPAARLVARIWSLSTALMLPQTGDERLHRICSCTDRGSTVQSRKSNCKYCGTFGHETAS
jgi:hypothetical protein